MASHQVYSRSYTAVRCAVRTVFSLCTIPTLLYYRAIIIKVFTLIIWRALTLHFHCMSSALQYISPPPNIMHERMTNQNPGRTCPRWTKEKDKPNVSQIMVMGCTDCFALTVLYVTASFSPSSFKQNTCPVGHSPPRERADALRSRPLFDVLLHGDPVRRLLLPLQRRRKW